MLKKTSFLAVLLVYSSAFAITTQNFQGGTGQTAYTLRRYGVTPGAEIINGTLRMVNTTNQNNVIAFNQTDVGLYNRITAEWDMSLVAGADGLGFALLNTAQYGASGAGPSISEEPSLTASFAVGFDIYCPDDYQKLGSHEISLHWDGVERANKWSPKDYRTGTLNRVRVVVDFVAGGAEVTVSVAGTVVYDKYFIAGMTPYDCRVAFGARTGGLMTTLYVDNINVIYESPTTAPQPPLTIQTFNQKLMNGSARDVKQTFNFPANDTVYERVVLRLKIEQPSGGWDPWDRMMGIYVWDAGNQNRYEIARFMTPYSKAGTWWIDVTDYQSLLRGSRQMGMWLDSWVGSDNPPVGYLITTDFDFYQGNPTHRVIGIRNLWVGTPTYGNADDPTMSKFFTTKNISIPANATKAKLRFMVTGHGQSPNSENAAEFLVRSRTATVNNKSYSNVLWRNDCYLNPCRPQSGTWPYSRAGWAPGDRVWPWDIDISSDILAGQTSAFGYTAQAYTNTSPDTNNIARHWVESQVIFYEPYTPDPIAHWQFNEGSGLTATDSSGNLRHGTLVNMDTTSWSAGKHCGALTFDGINDYVDIPGFKGITGSASRTCTAWIKTTQTSGEILSWGDSSGQGTKWIIRVNETGSLRAEVSYGAIFGATPVNDGYWHHIAVVLMDDGSTDISEGLLYVDGQPETIPGITAKAVNTTSSQNVRIGSHFVQQRYFRGQIDEVRIYNRTLSAAEIQALYQAHVLIGDMEPDGDVDLADFAYLAGAWQEADACDGDLTCDCIVDIQDILILVDEWLSVLPVL